jgi:hypothetical protein
LYSVEYPALIGDSSTRFFFTHGGGEHALLLQKSETILEVMFQPFSRPFSEQNQLIIDLLHVFEWNQSDCFVAVLTTKRLLLLDAVTLEIVSSVTHSTGELVNSTSSVAIHSAVENFHLEGMESILRRNSGGNTTTTATTNGRTPSGGFSHKIEERITGMNFIGNTLVFTSEWGIVRYLLPLSAASSAGKKMMLMMRRTPMKFQMIQRALGMNSSHYSFLTNIHSLSMGKICSLPRNLSSNFSSGLRVVGLFPDRLMITFPERFSQAPSSFSSLPGALTRFSSGSFFPTVSFRPWNPLEPLLMSLFTSHLRKSDFGQTVLPSSDEELWLDHALTIISSYSPVISADSATSSGKYPKIVPSCQLMSALAFHWECFAQHPLQRKEGMDKVGVQLTNLLLSSSNRTTTKHSELFPSGTWISAGVRSFWQLQSENYLNCVLEIVMNKRMSLVDLLLGHETFGGSHLPLPNSPLAVRLSSVAQIIMNALKTSSSSSTGGAAIGSIQSKDLMLVLRLFDISGDYATLLFTLNDLSANTKNQINASHSVMTAVLEEFHSSFKQLSYAAMNQLLKLCEYDCQESKEYKEILKYLKENRVVSLSNLTRTQRKKSMFASLSQLVPNALDSSSKSMSKLSDKIDLEVYYKSCQLFYNQKYGGNFIVGPYWNDLNTFPLKFFAYDVLEEYMGTQQQLEISSNDSNLSALGAGGAGGVGVGGAAGSGADNKSQFFKEQKILPTTWVSNVGFGRELDKVSGYYRFSDAFYPQQKKDGGFVCSAKPFTRISFLDLSRHESPGIELFYENQMNSSLSHQFLVDHSQSNINTGDKHDSTKLLCDVIHKTNLSKDSLTTITNSSNSMISSGMRLLVLRGSALDLGGYHYDLHRNKMTFEMTLSLLNSKEMIKTLLERQQMIVLAERRVISKTANPAGEVSEKGNSPAESIWKVFIDNTGFLSVQLGASPKVTSSLNILTTLFEHQSTKVINDEDGDNPPVNNEFTNYFHLAFTIDASSSICEYQASGNDYRLHYSSPVKVTLFYEGDKIAENNSSQVLPEQLESALGKTMIFFLPNCSIGYRVTEFRFWADNRTVQELNDQKENYLLLAEKRYRLQMQLKGTRKLFSSFKEIIVGEPTDSLVEYISPSEKEKQQQQTEEGEGKEATTTAGGFRPPKPTRFSLAMPSTAEGVGNIPQPAASAGSGSLHPPSTAVSSSSSSAVPTPAASAAPTAAMNARQRRLSALKDATQATAMMIQATHPQPPSQPVGPPPPVPGQLAKAPSFSAPVKEKDNEKDLFPPPPSSSFASFDAFSDVKQPFSPPVAAAFEEKATRKVSFSASASSASEPIEYSTALEEFSSAFSSAHWKNVLSSQKRIKQLSLPFYLSTFRKKKDELIIELLSCDPLDIASSALTKKEIRLSPEIINSAVTQYDEEKDVILVNTKVKPSSTAFAQMAICTTKSLEILDISSEVFPSSSSFGATVKRIVSIPLTSTPLAYYYFLTPELMILITPQEGFTWKPLLNPTTGQREAPVKILQRNDLMDVKLWQERTVLDVAVSSERWTLVISCQKNTGGGGMAENNFFERSQSFLVSIYHAKTGKSFVFRAVSGSFRTPGQLLLLFLVKGRAEMEWKLVSIDLNQLLTDSSSFALRPSSTVAANPHYQVPFEYYDLLLEKSTSLDGTLTDNSSEVDTKIMKALWSIAISASSQHQTTSTAFSTGRQTTSVDHQLASIFQIQEKIFVLFSEGRLVLLGSSSMKVFGELSIFSSTASSAAEGGNGKNEELLFLTSDFSNADDPFLLGLMVCQESEMNNKEVLKLAKIHLKSLTLLMKSQFQKK